MMWINAVLSAHESPTQQTTEAARTVQRVDTCPAYNGVAGLKR